MVRLACSNLINFDRAPLPSPRKYVYKYPSGITLRHLQKSQLSAAFPSYHHITVTILDIIDDPVFYLKHSFHLKTDKIRSPKSILNTRQNNG
jgi:hypothetical protein